MSFRSVTTACAIAVCAAVPAIAAETVLRVSNQGDALSMDPHSLAEAVQRSFTGNVYEPLVTRDKSLRLVPALATKWTLTGPTVWRFELRSGGALPARRGGLSRGLRGHPQLPERPLRQRRRDLSGRRRAARSRRHPGQAAGGAQVDVFPEGPQARDTSFFMAGWSPAGYDAHNALFALMATPQGSQGQWNLGAYSHPRLDELTRAIQSETDGERRTAMIHEALVLHRDDVGHVPLHQQTLAWAMRAGVEATQWPDNFMFFKWITVR
jgi:ABC-type transport system substrate-binding protein